MNRGPEKDPDFFAGFSQYFITIARRSIMALTIGIGNPNAGKSTLFNALTGLRQRVGNYPGVTVEKRTG